MFPLGRKQRSLVHGTCGMFTLHLCLKQLSVACNLILEGVRMITWRWTSSHRCSWMAVYVSCCIAQSNLIGSLCLVLHCYALLSPVNFHAVICLPSMPCLFILRRTPLVNYGPRSNLYHWYIFHCYYLLAANHHHLPHHTVNPLFSANRWDCQHHCSLGQSLEFVLWRFPSC